MNDQIDQEPQEGEKNVAMHVASRTLDGLGRFLEAICMPAAEEFGLYLKDKVSTWRANNAARMLKGAEKLSKDNGLKGKVHPRTLHEIIESASWQDDESVNKLWSGLLASAIGNGTEGGEQIFIEILKSLTPTQCKIAFHATHVCSVHHGEFGLLFADPLIISVEEALDLVGLEDVQRLDRELDDLHRKGLIRGAIDIEDGLADITPRPLLLHLIARCQSGADSPLKYYEAHGPIGGTRDPNQITLLEYEQRLKYRPQKYEALVKEHKDVMEAEKKASKS